MTIKQRYGILGVRGDRMSRKARTISDSDLHKALVNIFKSQGLDDKLAHDVATTSLARTRAENQML